MSQPTPDYGRTTVRDDDFFLGDNGVDPRVPPSGGGESSKAGRVKDTAVESGVQVASTAKEQATDVAREAKAQARDLFGDGRSEALRQAGEQQHKVAKSLRQVADELGTMAHSSDRSGVASEVVRQASDRARQTADWFDGREPGELLDDVRDYARRHPWTFLGVAAAAGIAVGRLGRAAAQNARDDSRSERSGNGSDPAGPEGTGIPGDGRVRPGHGYGTAGAGSFGTAGMGSGLASPGGTGDASSPYYAPGQTERDAGSTPPWAEPGSTPGSPAGSAYPETYLDGPGTERLP